MRPGLIHPGNTATRVEDVPLLPASMRPGLIHPGNKVLSGLLFREPPASMRPGLIHPGNTAAPLPARSRPPGFNEARADSPGK